MKTEGNINETIRKIEKKVARPLITDKCYEIFNKI